MENVARLFRDEIRDKKRVGSNIFSRVSTRKGGSNQALRTPYLYMSRKERKQLNGEAMVIYNMNDILEYGAFKTRPEKEQIQLMTYWMSKHKKVDVQKAMGVSSSTHYRLLEKLGLHEAESGKLRSRTVNFVLNEEEIETYKKELIDYEIFRQISTAQQNILFPEYIKKYVKIADLERAWEGSDLGYLYSVNARINKLKERDLVEVVEVKETENLEVPTEEIQEVVSENLSNEEDLDKPILSSDDDGHGSDIEIKTNSFSFDLKGRYNSKTIIKRLQLALAVLEDEEELLDLEIKITH
ncbi:hypothetical protein V7094_28995 [Priestia megaterium]|uniref:hypothetical protein n=1 Tax=Priestia megaterium TaxID=1404 RepID=UPI002FFE4AC0